MKNSKEKKALVRGGILAAVIIFVMVLVSQTIGLGRTGFDTRSYLEQFWFYVGPGLGFLFGIFILYVCELAIKEDDKKYGDSLCFNSPGRVPAAPLGIFKDWRKLVLLSLIVFSVLGVYAAFTNTTFTGIGNVEQQFTVVDSLIFKGALIPPAEKLGAAFAFAFVLFLWRYACREFNWPRGLFIAVSILLALMVFASFGYLNHIMRYETVEIALFTVLLFWTVGGLLTALSGSFIPFWIMHIANNLFFELGKHYTNQIVAVWTGGFVILLGLTYILLFVRRKNVS